jgi:hypothetical protein
LQGVHPRGPKAATTKSVRNASACKASTVRNASTCKARCRSNDTGHRQHCCKKTLHDRIPSSALPPYAHHLIIQQDAAFSGLR